MIVLLGSSGYFGRAFAAELRRRGQSFIPLTRTAFDYTRFDYLFDYLRTMRPAVPHQRRRLLLPAGGRRVGSGAGTGHAGQRPAPANDCARLPDDQDALGPSLLRFHLHRGENHGGGPGARGERPQPARRAGVI